MRASTWTEVVHQVGPTDGITQILSDIHIHLNSTTKEYECSGSRYNEHSVYVHHRPALHHLQIQPHLSFADSCGCTQGDRPRPQLISEGS